jgi:REP-associated tyrosine transposase
MELAQSNKPYHSNHSIVYSCQYHVIFCPKYRRKVLLPPLDTRLKALILEKQETYGYAVLGMEVMPDHVHLLLDVNPQIGIAKIVGQIKGYTAHMLRTEYPWLKKRLPSLWTRSKFVSSVGAVTLEMVQRYIESQKGQ